MISVKKDTITLDIPLKKKVLSVLSFLNKHSILLLSLFVAIISTASFIFYLQNGLGLAYNDARSHLDIGRRVVEGLKPGLAQLGSVWLPLPHFLMIFTIWNDFMWHSGLSGAILSMGSFIATSILIYLFLKEINVSQLGRIVGVLVFVTNINILYLQSTAMTELLLIATMTAAAYEILKWFKADRLFNLIKAAFWIMLSTLIRYDGWFLFLFAIMIICLYVWKRKGFKEMEGTFFLFATLAGFGVILWLLWNLLIFNDPLYFIFLSTQSNMAPIILRHVINMLELNTSA